MENWRNPDRVILTLSKPYPNSTKLHIRGECLSPSAGKSHSCGTHERSMQEHRNWEDKIHRAEVYSRTNVNRSSTRKRKELVNSTSCAEKSRQSPLRVLRGCKKAATLVYLCDFGVILVIMTFKFLNIYIPKYILQVSQVPETL